MTPAIYVEQTRAIKYAELIAKGYKTIETRNRNTLGQFVGQRVLIIRTRKGYKPDVVGSAVIADAAFYTEQELENARNMTLIPPGSKFDCHGRGKWGYIMSEPVAFESAKPLSEYNVVKRTRSYAMVD